MNHLTNEALNLYLDDALGSRERAAADAHLAVCEACQAELSTLQRLFATIEALPLDPLPADLAARVLEQIAFAPEPRTNQLTNDERRTTNDEQPEPRTENREPELQTTNYGRYPRPALAVAVLAVQVALAVGLAIWLAPQLMNVVSTGLGTLPSPAPFGLTSILAALNSWLTAAGVGLSGLARAGGAVDVGPFGGFTTAQWGIILVGVGLVWLFGSRFLLAGSPERRSNHQEAA